MNFWSVKNVQKYLNCINPSLSTPEILCHAALEVLRVHYLNTKDEPCNYISQLRRQKY